MGRRLKAGSATPLRVTSRPPPHYSVHPAAANAARSGLGAQATLEGHTLAP